MDKLCFEQIHPESFCHPADLRAQRVLEKIPLVGGILKKLASINVEQRFRIYHMYNSVRVDERQFRSLYLMVNEVAEIFSMEVPHIFLAGNETKNAFAFGLEEHAIVLTSQLVDAMEEREIRAIIAHELAHILCEHMLYRKVGLTLADSNFSPLSNVSRLPVLRESLTAAFFSWYRAAEYSADRAAVLALQDPEPIISVLARLAGVPRRYLDEFDIECFAGQASEQAEEASVWSRILAFDMGSFLTHPEPTKRALAIIEWVRSGQYQAILDGRYVSHTDVAVRDRIRIEGVKSCVLCGRPVGESTVCAGCGLEQDTACQQSCPNGHPCNLDWRHCPRCRGVLATS